MTRIVGGTCGGRRIQVPKSGTRPTSERVREALMSALASRLGEQGLGWSDARVLDLFAGSGALGLEALSRGAAAVVLVDADASAAKTAAMNVDALAPACPGSAEVVRCAAGDFLARDRGGFQVVLMDPPYALASEQVRALVHRAATTSPGAVIAVERRKGEDSPMCDHVDGIVERRYGDTSLWYGRANRGLAHAEEG